MNVLQIGVGQVWKCRRIWWLWYALTLGLAIIGGLGLKSYLESNVGHSLMLEDVVKGFNYTFLNDFMLHYGAGFSVILQQSGLMILLFLLLMVFMVGGTLSVFKMPSLAYDSAIFWGGSAKYFWRMLRLTLYFFVIHIAIAALFFFVYFTITKGFSPNVLKSDTVIFTTWKWLLPLYLLVAAFFFMWQDYAKIGVVRSESGWIFLSIWKAFRLLRSNFKQAYGFYLLNMSLLGVLFLVQYFINKNISTENTGTIVLSFLIAQLFIIVRLGLKLFNLSVVNTLFDNFQNRIGK